MGVVAVVTGAAGGLGLGLAQQLAARHMALVLADIDAAALGEAAGRLEATGARVVAVPTDVTKADQVGALAAHAIDRFGRVDVVCLNAGVSMRGRAWDLSVDDWRWIHDVNVFGVVHGIQSFVPLLLRQGDGHVLITASNSSVGTLAGLAPYVSSKHAVLALGETLFHDLREEGSPVRVSVALPSAIRSGMADAVRHRPPDYGTAAVADDVLRASRAFLERNGEDPHAMAGRILEQALDQGRFAIFTEPHDVGTMTARVQALADGKLPDVAMAPIGARP